MMRNVKLDAGAPNYNESYLPHVPVYRDSFIYASHLRFHHLSNHLGLRDLEDDKILSERQR